ncbi:MAG TPA: DUF4145 domain-containing protein [Terriglobales bacterium]|nr:DUF4145 domain-containing protein [Terriglobales bacterium]
MDTLRSYAKTAAKHGFKLDTHSYYVGKARESVTKLRHDYLLMKSRYPRDPFPDIAKQLDAIEEPVSRIEQGLHLPPDDLLDAIEQVALRVGSDLRVAIQTKSDNQLNEPFITPEILPLGVYRKVLDEANRCFAQGCPNACAAMLRRLVESLIIEAFESKAIEERIKDSSGEYLELKALIGKATSEPALKLTRNTRNALPHLKFLGDMSVHARRNLVRPDDLRGVRNDARVAIEELASHLPK